MENFDFKRIAETLGFCIQCFDLFSRFWLPNLCLVP